jgi:hypothetical protein
MKAVNESLSRALASRSQMSWRARVISSSRSACTMWRWTPTSSASTTSCRSLGNGSTSNAARSMRARMPQGHDPDRAVASVECARAVDERRQLALYATSGSHSGKPPHRCSCVTAAAWIPRLELSSLAASHAIRIRPRARMSRCSSNGDGGPREILSTPARSRDRGPGRGRAIVCSAVCASQRFVTNATRSCCGSKNHIAQIIALSRGQPPRPRHAARRGRRAWEGMESHFSARSPRPQVFLRPRTRTPCGGRGRRSTR